MSDLKLTPESPHGAWSNWYTYMAFTLAHQRHRASLYETARFKSFDELKEKVEFAVAGAVVKDFPDPSGNRTPVDLDKVDFNEIWEFALSQLLLHNYNCEKIANDGKEDSAWDTPNIGGNPVSANDLWGGVYGHTHNNLPPQNPTQSPTLTWDTWKAGESSYAASGNQTWTGYLDPQTWAAKRNKPEDSRLA